jgi:hypothetical protein
MINGENYNRDLAPIAMKIRSEAAEQSGAAQ